MQHVQLEVRVRLSMLTHTAQGSCKYSDTSVTRDTHTSQDAERYAEPPPPLPPKVTTKVILFQKMSTVLERMKKKCVKIFYAYTRFR